MKDNSKNKKMSLATAKDIYSVVEEAIIFHKAIKDGLADALIWNNVVPTKKGGILCIDTLLSQREYTSKEINEIKQFRDYWNQNYKSMREQVFYRKSPKISKSELI